ncbi:MAG: hypothetical protein ACQGVC_04990 [Myxococcota bacterium]
MASKPIRFLFPFLFLGLVWAGPALADEPAEARSLTTRQLITQSRTVGDPGTRPSALHPVAGLYAQAFPIRSLGLWAQGHGFSLSRRAAMYDVEGGAALRLDEGIHLTASYRMLGLDLGFDSDVEGADGEPGIAAPFVGLAFDF